MEVGLYPTERQVCRALLNAIATHPLIKDPGIYFPAVVGDRPVTEPVRITKWRLFGGVELIEEGLTLAVFPLHSSFKTTTALYTPSTKDKSMQFGHLDNRTELGASNIASQGGTLRIVVQLYIRETAFDAPIKIKSDVTNLSELTSIIPHGDQVQLTDEPQLEVLDDATSYAVDQNILDVQILPGEEILRDYIPLLRSVIRDIQVLRPFYIRNPCIHLVDYPTSNWIREGENIIFHTAYILVEYDISEPGIRSGYATHTEPVFTYPKPRIINVDDQRGDKYNL